MARWTWHAAWYASVPLCAMLLLCLNAGSAAGAAHTVALPRPRFDTLSPTERWVSNQVAAGNIADLSTRPDRDLSARFLEQLLTSPPDRGRVGWRGVRIINALVRGPLDLQNADVPYATELDNTCFMFKDATATNQVLVDLSQSHFAKSVPATIKAAE